MTPAQEVHLQRALLARLARPPPAQAEAELRLPGRQALPRRGLHASSSASSRAEPKCSISRDPRLEDRAIWTATAPEAVFTSRT